jgi:UDP-N-acetylglucosamine 2-epimerase (non-hydrolysing)
MSLKILSVAGSRQNMMKLAAICEAINEFNGRAAGEEIQHVLVQIRQQSDSKRSDSYFNDLALPGPDLCLEIGSASHSVQTAQIMERLETVILRERPHVVLTVGNSDLTVGCALVAKRISWSDERGANQLPKLAHVGAGLRSFDRSVPEEINGVLTDSISDYLFTTEESASRNLLREGVPDGRVFLVGNVLIDTLLRHRSKAQESTILEDLQLADGAAVKSYAILTLHRSANVEDKEILVRLLDALLAISKSMPIIFPADPRILKRIQSQDLSEYFVDHAVQEPEPLDGRVRIRLVPELGYLDFIRLMSEARVVLTDSGGIQDETTMLGVPCITLGNNTERPVTLEQGTNVLAGSNPEKIIAEFNRAHSNRSQSSRVPSYWDGNAARRIIEVLLDDFHSKRSLVAAASSLESRSAAHHPH